MECESFDWGTSEEYIDYGTMYVSRYALLHKAYARFVKKYAGRLFRHFVRRKRTGWKIIRCLWH